MFRLLVVLMLVNIVVETYTHIMKASDLKQYKLPDSPGVYFFRGARKQILYIGKATSIKSRVRSYFVSNIAETRSPLILAMLQKAKTVTFIKTDSVLEALILEASLIKKYQPVHNTREKDDKSFQYVVLTNETYPKVLLVRGKDLNTGDVIRKLGKIKYEFGPFTQGGALREGLKIIRKIFPFRDKCTPKSDKLCFNAQIGLCPGVCDNRISKKEYTRNIRNIKLFFQGKKKDILKQLNKQMKEASKNLYFEDALKIKKQIFSLEHINDVALIKNDLPIGKNSRIEGYDIAHISGKFVVGVMVVVSGGVALKSEYRKFKIKSFEGADDTRALREVLKRRFNHEEWARPNLIVMDGGKAQFKVGCEFGKTNNISVVSVVKDDKHKPKGVLGEEEIIKKFKQEILLVNSEAHRFAIKYHRSLRDKIR